MILYRWDFIRILLYIGEIGESKNNIKYLEETATKRYLMILLCAALLSVCAAALAEEMPIVHDGSHQTVEREHSQPSVIKTDSMDTHTWVTVYDLFCVDCGRVIEENVRSEEKQEPHIWNVTRKEPTCKEEGMSISVCTVCGAEKTDTLPQLAHVYADESLLKGRNAGSVTGTGEYAGLLIGEVIAAPTCTDAGIGALLCLTCQTVAHTVILPARGHEWNEWTAVPVPEDEICVSDSVERRQCRVCGEEETRVVGAAPGHKWQETMIKEATCTEQGESLWECEVCHAVEKKTLAALGHSYGSILSFIKHEAGPVMGMGEKEAVLLGEVVIPSTCTESGSGILLCLRCQTEERSIVIPSGGHTWSEWEQQEVPEDQICVTDLNSVRHCLDCGLEETETLAPAPGHQWIAVSFTEPTCTEKGRAVRQCAVCKKEEIIEAPCLGHCYLWMDVKQANGSTVSEYVCTICGDVAERRSKVTEQVQMYYNNTITSFGPTTRDLIGGGVWNRVTPLDLAEEGMFTYPLIASNLFTVGTATVINENGTQLITYKLSSAKITVHSETLVFYPNLEALLTGENAVILEFDQPLELKDYFGEDQRVLMAITLKADYDAMAYGIQGFREDEELIAAMTELID